MAEDCTCQENCGACGPTGTGCTCPENRCKCSNCVNEAHAQKCECGGSATDCVCTREGKVCECK
ncbi:hypothetical protein F5J12DRAFT_720385 [Pisolithus orientalis]|uniref:uncharacterized protein n=1 Tax=Pisolithus orientalis TaxID=936130 RepID=UPI002224EA3C|nr:uncharacterized protein F5J12DRAFT_720385 [Pisolithus orientalis]KAI6007594.1 hypothetical protein F5J12DRAFT_720385 [Pisolithus orientalis]